MELKDCMFHVVSMIYRGGIYKGESIGLERLYKHILPFLKILNRLEKIYLYDVSITVKRILPYISNMQVMLQLEML